MTQYHLLIHDDFRKQMSQLHAAYKADPTSRQGKEFATAYTAMKAVVVGRAAGRNAPASRRPRIESRCHPS